MVRHLWLGRWYGSADVNDRDGRVAVRGEARGPAFRALAILALSAFALVATSAPVPTLEGRAIGEVVLGPGESTERELRIHVDPAADAATAGTISLAFQAASGLQVTYTRDATLSFVAASDSVGSFPARNDFPVERCTDGCDLLYRIRIAAGPAVLPGSVTRYEVAVEMRFDYSSRQPDPSYLRLDLDGLATGPVEPIWSILAGVVALVGGIAAGPALDRAVGPRRRRWPAFVLIVVAAGMIAWTLFGSVFFFANLRGLSATRISPNLLIAVFDPWSVILLGALAWGVWRGLRRWTVDGGWLLGVGAVAMAGLGGLWLAWWLTANAVVQPVALAVPFVVLGLTAGVVIGQAWRTDARARHDRWWVALAVLGHGVVIAGFGFLAAGALDDRSNTGNPTSLLALIPAALVALAFRRWLGGRIAWLVLFDVLIAATGLLGVWAWTSLRLGLAGGTPFQIGDVAVAVAVVASLVAMATAFRAIRPSSGLDDDDAAGAGPPEAIDLSPAEPGAARPTT
jgi:hypothetical protein